ncbi:hypothetical protein J2M53_04725 [Arthrobacter sp. zg-ZUI100]|uniref:hypothetical protein n=1 Tax=Arthrobacter jiangjiafuii TaxID=2817475 RepID=UPI001AEEE037|nr:hypothetical protein [Arthrobacter jiangjiafuii]MBP3035561.1 hypothetical protein [Arthrobacter jiangjiafuii]
MEEGAFSGRTEAGAGLHVKGGSQGLTVEYQELQAVAGKLEEKLEVLRDLQFRGADHCNRLYGLSAAPEDASHAAVAVETAVRELRADIEDLAGAARGLREASRNYLDTEGRLESALKKVPGSLGLAVLDWKNNGGGYPGRRVTELLVPQHDEAIISLFTALASGMVGGLRHVDVVALEGNHGRVTLSGTAGGLLGRSRELQHQDPGVIEILTINRDGRQVRIVTLPGTQPGSVMVGANPFDAYGNAEARAEDSRYVANAVAEALRQGGAAAQDPVILVGYSQGGIHAVNTGARLVETGEFSVRMILTAGAPRGDRDVPDGVKVLHLEHTRDWVAGADGSSNPDTPDRITVTGTAPVPLLPDVDPGLGPAHSLDSYLDLAAAADASTDPSLTDQLGQLGQLVGPGTVASRNLFQLSRSRPPGLARLLPAVPAPAVPVPPVGVCAPARKGAGVPGERPLLSGPGQ